MRSRVRENGQEGSPDQGQDRSAADIRGEETSESKAEPKAMTPARTPKRRKLRLEIAALKEDNRLKDDRERRRRNPNSKVVVSNQEDGQEEEAGETVKAKRTRKRKSDSKTTVQGSHFVDRAEKSMRRLSRSPIKSAGGTPKLSPRSRRKASTYDPSPPHTSVSPRKIAKKAKKQLQESSSEEEKGVRPAVVSNRKDNTRASKPERSKTKSRKRTRETMSEDEEDSVRDEVKEQPRKRRRLKPKARSKKVTRREESSDDAASDVEPESADEGGDFKLARILRCHSANEDPNDDQTNVYGLDFHPEEGTCGSMASLHTCRLNTLSVIDHILATAGGDSICIYDCKAKRLIKKYKHPLQAGKESAISTSWFVPWVRTNPLCLCSLLRPCLDDAVPPIEKRRFQDLCHCCRRQEKPLFRAADSKVSRANFIVSSQARKGTLSSSTIALGSCLPSSEFRPCPACL